MPKIVSRSVTCSDIRQDRQGEADSVLETYFCWCGHTGLILDCKIHKLPLRKRDNSRVLDTKKHNFRLSCIDTKRPMRPEDITYVKWRDDCVEKQYRLKCKFCNLWSFYKHKLESDVIFIVNRAMSYKSCNPLLAVRNALGSASTAAASTSRTNNKSQTNQDKSMVMATTLQDDEIEEELKAVDRSYEMNATFVQRELERQQKKQRYY
ncbi:UPF0428 protein CXorf56-like protein [Fragariocoptes setiger]|uniref:STING ER exit protein n=1 Tax=Fragariocoptes setiger TaxID=1670756 RepID=A0ABQ7S6F3_9ACAR|nr:UPF0428 protein CXorf56-like protein [Fragariocoptes setiger]